MTNDLIIDTPVGGQPPVSPMELARRASDADLRGQATPEEVAWLYAHPHLWHRAVIAAIEATQAHIHRDRTSLRQLRLAELAEAAGQGLVNPQPSAEYLVEAARVGQLTTRRTHFEQKARRRLHDVESLAGGDLGEPTRGEVITALLGIAEMAGNGTDPTQIRRRALGIAGALQAAATSTEQVADNTDAAPVRLRLSGLKSNTKINCRVCHKGKIDPLGPSPHRCPRCHQQHEFDLWKAT